MLVTAENQSSQTDA